MSLPSALLILAPNCKFSVCQRVGRKEIIVSVGEDLRVEIWRRGHCQQRQKEEDPETGKHPMSNKGKIDASDELGGLLSSVYLIEHKKKEEQEGYRE